MAVNKLETSGKWATAANWSTGVRPTATTDAEIPTGKEGKIEAAAACRSLVMNGTLAASSELAIGTSTAQEFPAAENIILKIASGGVVTWSGILRLISTASSTSTISSGSHVLNEIIISKSGKYKLEGSLKSSRSIILEESTSLECATHALEAKYLQVLGTSSINIESSTITIIANAIGEGWHVEPTATLNGGSTSTIIFTNETPNTEKQFNGGGKSYGVVTFVSNTKVESSNTFSKLNNNTSFPTAECKGTLTALSNHLVVTSGEANLYAGCEITGTAIPVATTIIKKIEAGVWEMSVNATETILVAETVTIYAIGIVDVHGTTQTITTFACDGTKSEPARMISSKLGETVNILIPESIELTSYLRIKDHSFNNTLYLPNGTDLGGNTNVKFEAKPTAVSSVLPMMI